jgi:CBS domain-containing protein
VLIVITISQVMKNDVAALHSMMTVRETIEFLTTHHIGGAPVVNGAGELVGIVSELALIDVVFDAAVQDRPVSQYMTTEVHAVEPHEPLSRAAQLFALYAFRRLPVVERGKLVGVITRRDLMNHALESGQVLGDPLLELVPTLAASPDCMPQIS